MSVPWHTRRFWLVLVSAAVGMAMTFSLGRWQLARAAQKEALQAAIVSREYGIPGVVGCKVATARIRDGDRVTVNGNTGEIALG